MKPSLFWSMIVKAWGQHTGEDTRHIKAKVRVANRFKLSAHCSKTTTKICHTLLLNVLPPLEYFVHHLYGWALLSIYNLRAPLSFSAASRACPAVYLQPNHWWHSLDVWPVLTVIPAYHKPHCCQARGTGKQTGGHTTMMNNGNGKTEDVKGRRNRNLCVCVCCCVFLRQKHLDHNMVS